MIIFLVAFSDRPKNIFEHIHDQLLLGSFLLLALNKKTKYISLEQAHVYLSWRLDSFPLPILPLLRFINKVTYFMRFDGLWIVAVVQRRAIFYGMVHTSAIGTQRTILTCQIRVEILAKDLLFYLFNSLEP